MRRGRRSRPTRASKLTACDPKRDGGCAVALGYDADMPSCYMNEYLYDKQFGWPWPQGCPDGSRDDAGGPLNDDVRRYIEKITTTAEGYDCQLQFFIQGNTFERPVDAAF